MFKVHPKYIAEFDHKILRPLLTRILPPNLIVKIYSHGREAYLKKLATAKIDLDFSLINKEVACFKNNLIFRNDLGNAAGLDKDGELLDFSYRLGAGYALLGTVLNKPHAGNRFPCFGKKCNPWAPLHFSNSALNSLGLPSKGVHSLRENILRFRNSHEVVNFPIGVSLMGHPLADEEGKIAGVIECMDILADCVDFFEINESCPNTQHDAGHEALRLRTTKIVAKRSEMRAYRPLLFKLADFGNLANTLDFYSAQGIDGLSFANTIKDYPSLVKNIKMQDLRLFNYYIENYQGGLSGEIIKEYVFRRILEASSYIQKNNLPIKLVHIGGIATRTDIDRSRASTGAQNPIILRQWYTGLMQAIAEKPLDTIYAEML